MPAIKLTVNNSNVATDLRPSIADNSHFLTTLDALEDAACDMSRFSTAKPGTIEGDVLQPQADERWDTARSEFYSVIDGLLASARQEGAAALLKALQGV